MAINIFDFNVAMQERNFAYMSDIYNEMMRFESGDSCGDEYYFTEVMDGYTLVRAAGFSAHRSKAKNKEIRKGFADFNAKLLSLFCC